jgi:hypothetical protein
MAREIVASALDTATDRTLARSNIRLIDAIRHE